MNKILQKLSYPQRRSIEVGCKYARFILYAVSVMAIAYGVIAWRVDWGGNNWWLFVVVGAFLVTGLIYGKIIGFYLFMGSMLSLLFLGLTILVRKGDQINSYFGVEWAIASVVGLLLGAFFYAIGAQRIWQEFQIQEQNSQKKVACSACDQYLGFGGSFDAPCPRCGSNRYKLFD